MELSGTVGLSTNVGGFTVGPVEASLDDDFGLGDPSGSLYGRVDFAAGPIHVSGSVFRYSESGSERLSVAFGGLTANALVDSTIEFTSGRGGISFDLIDLGIVRLSPGVGVDLLDVEMRATERSSGRTETIDEILPVPIVTLRGEVDADDIGAFVDLGAMDVDLGDVEGTLVDVEAVVWVEITDPLRLFAGYRWISIDADGTTRGDRFTTDLEMTGWIVGGGVEF